MWMQWIIIDISLIYQSKQNLCIDKWKYKILIVFILNCKYKSKGKGGLELVQL
jgi:hypothetical protein